LLICGCLALVLLSGGSWATFRLVRRDVVDWQHANVHVLVQTDVKRWLDDDAIHQPNAAFTLDQPVSVDPAFAAYYSAYRGETLLGTPLTTAFPIDDGLIQFFSSGALLLPTDAAQASPTAPLESVARLLPQDDVRDAATGIVRLALLPRLLTAGSTMPVGGEGSSLTYVDLRRAALPDALVRKPTPSRTFQAGLDVFIPEVEVNGSVRGHRIPQDIWTYLTRQDVAPDGWLADLGAPLTEAIPFTIRRNGRTIQARVQAFAREALVVYPGDDGDVTIEPAGMGSAYLDTLGPPAVKKRSLPSLWAARDTSVQSMPGGDTVQAHVGSNFALTWTGGFQWVGDRLWYQVQWQPSRTRYSGWVQATSVTFTSPGNARGSAEFDALAPDLEAYLQQQGRNTGATVYDLTRGQYYTYNADTQFIMASSAKVPIMLTLLAMVEQQQRQPTGDEMNLLTAMIENSDNDAAQALFDEIGGAGPMDAFMSKAGIDGFAANPDGWGYSTIAPLAMVRLLTLLHDGKVLNSAQDRQLAINLMENVESDQQVGVGDTAPAHATVALKDGWVQDPDGLWAVNTSGIVTVGGETYIISAYTQRQNALDASQDMLRHVCAAVAQSLAPA
ncbi:MAG: serine hydrolase, partial [Ktedonobacterales bacterium]